VGAVARDPEQGQVRLLPARPDHGRRRAAEADEEAHRRRHRRHRERLPVRVTFGIREAIKTAAATI
jgi:hypothetical protein